MDSGDMNETVDSFRYGCYKKFHNNEIFNLPENAGKKRRIVF
jgi:hypothetical protein